MKRLVLILLCAALAFSLSSCITIEKIPETPEVIIPGGDDISDIIQGGLIIGGNGSDIIQGGQINGGNLSGSEIQGNATGFTYQIKDNHCIITGIEENVGGVVVIPSMILGYPVLEIGERAFYDCYNITSVTLPEGLTTISAGAFMYCSKLTTINMPRSLTCIGDSAFFKCTSLTDVTIPESVEEIRTHAFFGCQNLKTISFEDPYWWYVNGDTAIDVTNAENNAKNFINIYNAAVWTKV